MKTNRLWTTLTSIPKPVLPTIAAVAVLAAGADAVRAQDPGDWEFEFAYTLDVQAYIYPQPC